MMPLVRELTILAQQELANIRRYVALQGIGAVQLREQIDDVALGRRLLVQARSSLVPELADRTLSIEQADEGIGCRRKTVIPLRAVILEHIPQLPAVKVPVNFYVAAQARFQRRDAIPKVAEGSRHGENFLRQPGPDQQSKPVDAAMSPEPNQPSLADVDFAHAFHAGPQLGWRLIHLGFNTKIVASLACGGD